VNGADAQVVLVTGGSRGLGRAIAVEFARRRHHVVINFRSQRVEAETTAGLVERAGGTAELRQADVSRADEVDGLFEGLSRLDVLVNNAGVTRDEYLLTMGEDSWRKVLATNLTAIFHCTRMAARLMCAARSGVIVNIGSSSAASARVAQVNYCTAKAALLGYSRSLARDLAARRVRVMTVAPGFTATDMADAVPDSLARQTLARIPLNRWGRPEEVARAVAFLASDLARGFSGQTLLVDGGRTAFETEMAL
jgi:3-oxoacyl-[acyl-carrier protein] reductase